MHLNGAAGRSPEQCSNRLCEEFPASICKTSLSALKRASAQMPTKNHNSYGSRTGPDRDGSGSKWMLMGTRQSCIPLPRVGERGDMERTVGTREGWSHLQDFRLSLHCGFLAAPTELCSHAQHQLLAPAAPAYLQAVSSTASSSAGKGGPASPQSPPPPVPILHTGMPSNEARLCPIHVGTWTTHPHSPLPPP